MPYRTTPLLTGQYYHIYNRGVNKQPIFYMQSDYLRAIEVCAYYRYSNPPVRYSYFIRLSHEEKKRLLNTLENDHENLVIIVVYTLMPNHFHLIVKQIADEGVSQFISIWENSLTRFINTKHQRVGPLFQGPFKAVRVEDDNQLIHLSRYIHLNPYTSYIVKSIDQLKNYPWSSYLEYINLAKTTRRLCNAEVILSAFKNREAYEEFVLDRADYQRELNRIKHLQIE